MLIANLPLKGQRGELRLIEKQSPFMPGRPVTPELFVGRQKELDRLKRLVLQSFRQQRVECAFVTGDRGIGKSSVAQMLAAQVEFLWNGYSVHSYLGLRAKSLEDAIERIVTDLLARARQQGWWERAKSLLGKFVEKAEFGLFGTTIRLNLAPEERRQLAFDFLAILTDLLTQATQENRGWLLILDDLTGIAPSSEFALFIKSLVDSLATSRQPAPFCLILVGLPERRDEMMRNQPSIARIFDVIVLNRLEDEFVSEFFRKAFEEQAGMKIAEEALDAMVKASGGYPALMHEVGDAVFWANNDDFIDFTDASKGLIDAAEQVGRKYLDRQVYEALRSERYRELLRKCAQIAFNSPDGRIRRRDLSGADNFLRRMIDLSVLKRISSGEYRFANELYMLYALMEAETSKRAKVR